MVARVSPLPWEMQASVPATPRTPRTPDAERDPSWEVLTLSELEGGANVQVLRRNRPDTPESRYTASPNSGSFYETPPPKRQNSLMAWDDPPRRQNSKTVFPRESPHELPPGSDPMRKRLSTQRGLSRCAALDHRWRLRALLKRYPPNERDEDGDRAPLHWAAARGHVRCVELLLAAGADAVLDDAAGYTAADLARQAGHEALALRIERGAPLPDPKRVRRPPP